MAYSTINKSTLYQNQLLWDGTGATNARTGLGFQPDFCWGKERSSTSGHILQDSVQGLSVYLSSNSDSLTNPTSVQFTSFDSDGFTLGTSTGINQSGQTNVGWAWKAGTTGSGTTTGAGTGKAYSYSVNTTSGFSITKYLGNSTAGHTIPHTLGVVPKMLFVKKLTSPYAASWRYGSDMIGWDKVMFLDTTAAATTYTSGEGWNGTAPTSSVFTLGNDSTMNATDVSYIAYVFADVQGYSKFGSYTGNGSIDGTFVYTGFSPAFLMVKRTDTTGVWGMYDNKRIGFNQSQGVQNVLRANSSDATATGGGDAGGYGGIDFLSNGFKCKLSDGNMGASGGTYIYMAFGQPIISNSGTPATAR